MGLASGKKFLKLNFVMAAIQGALIISVAVKFLHYGNQNHDSQCLARSLMFLISLVIRSISSPFRFTEEGRLKPQSDNLSQTERVCPVL